MKSAFFLFILLVCLSGCKGKKVSLTGNEPVEISDFLDSFAPVKLPFQVADSSFSRRENDSLLIGYKVFTQFVPDSVLAKEFGKGIHPKIYPVGKAVSNKKETYLFIKLIHGNKKIIDVACFDKKNQFIAAMPFLQTDQVAATAQVSSMDKNFTLFKNITRKNPNGSVSEGKDVYVLNADGKNFMLIMTDALDAKPAELINPIDTLPRKNKFSADYVKNKTNLISVRDGLRPGRIIFFIHFEDTKADCTGELKGEASFVSANKAVYRSAGDPCVLELTFTSSAATMKELEGCGSHRGLRCLFNGTFPRKKEVKKKQLTKKSTLHK
jgi:hypothetical protein